MDVSGIGPHSWVSTALNIIDTGYCLFFKILAAGKFSVFADYCFGFWFLVFFLERKREPGQGWGEW